MTLLLAAVMNAFLLASLQGARPGVHQFLILFIQMSQDKTCIFKTKKDLSQMQGIDPRCLHYVL